MGASNSRASGNYPPSRQVQTTYGLIEGRRFFSEDERQVDAFQGVPYAATPIGELRFSMPVAHEKWEDVRETKAFGARGIQKDGLLSGKIGPQSEDNLTLNIFTPVWKAETTSGFPVLVFIHGGAFVSDSAVKYGDLNISKYLVRKDVIVVTVQYRLGFLGFWTTGDETIPDNLALHDMTFALKWIRENIKEFGGDVDNITLMGQSAGGDAVDLLSISPVSRDLFHKVIPMGGNASCSWSIKETPLKACRIRAESIGIHDPLNSADWIHKLRQIPADKFAAGMEIDPNREDTQMMVGPKFDSVFLPKPLMELRKESPVKPRLVGCARSEGLIMCIIGLDSKNPLNQILKDLANILPETKFPLHARHVQSEAITKLIDIGCEHSKEEWNRAMSEIKGDFFMNVGVQTNILDVLDTQPTTPIYFYSFDFYNPKAYGIIGYKMPFKDATHCTDISYVVGTHIVGNFEWAEEDIKMIELTTRLWTNFAKYGDPNGVQDSETVLGETKWLPATAENPQAHLALDLLPRMESTYKNGRPLYIAQLLRETSTS
ncbi:unnamed protein product [Caenorhabditis angaria]|uniref:Carboxylic ester hydrolase n=1 Tax=Caenorhabditis angaria TaxID=860376 RepID=A0A9P1IHU5_9PELO|nr:unnamed protein product [Caenorhabditis angaria]